MRKLDAEERVELGLLGLACLAASAFLALNAWEAIPGRRELALGAAAIALLGIAIGVRLLLAALRGWLHRELERGLVIAALFDVGSRAVTGRDDASR